MNLSSSSVLDKCSKVKTNSNVLSMDEQVNKLCYIHIMKHYSAVKVVES